MRQPARVIRIALLTASFLAYLAQPIAAETDVSKQIARTAQSIQRYLGLLKSPSEATRIAALTEMANSNDPTLADLAIETALASTDAKYRAIALRAGFRQVRSLVAKLTPDASASSRAVIEACGNAVQYRIEDYDPSTGTFKVQGQDNIGIGQVSGLTVSITIDYGCSMTGTLQPDRSLAGIVSAPYKKGALPARANFR